MFGSQHNDKRGRGTWLSVALLGAVAATVAGREAFATAAPALQLVAPTITVAVPRVNPTSATSARFGFAYGTSLPQLSFGCALDGARFRACSSPIRYRRLRDGAHTFRVAARSASGAWGPAAARSWHIDTTGPAIRFVFPASGGRYDAGLWRSLCSAGTSCRSRALTRAGQSVRGWATDPSGVAAVNISLEQFPGRRYWNGVGFATRRPVFLTATLGSPSAKDTAWNLPLPAPPPGTYRLSSYGIDTLGNGGRGARRVVVWFTIEAPPSASGGSSVPSAPATQPATSGATITGVSSTGVEPATTGGPTILDFTVRGDVHGGLLFPGGQALPIKVSFSNPNPFAISLTVLAVSVHSVTGPPASGAPPCSTSDFAVTQVGATLPLELPPGSSTLSDLGVAQGDWPQLRMVETGHDQDACRSATVTLEYQAVGTR
jgi:hypothetical protein